ncbi:MAG TPA: serine hydroxymethyltransferase [Planctomycetota bacterium]|nr:serine hydroxymethyltransferase [Planctomycetota bacterium]
MNLQKTDPAAFELLRTERKFRAETLDFVPSNNHPSPAVLEAERMYPLFYSENDGRNFYYPGCETVKAVEELAKARALAVFPGSEYVNVKPTDGTRGNEAIYRAFLKPGDTLMSLGLADGGHLSHGLKWNYSGMDYRIVSYGVTADGKLDYDAIRDLAKQERPKMIVAGGSSCPFRFDFAKFAAIAKEFGASLHADISHFAGLCVTGDHPTPFPHADTVMTTIQKTLRGQKGAIAFCRQDRGRDMDRAVFPGVMAHATGAQLLAKAVALGEAATPAFKAYVKLVVDDIQALAAGLLEAGFKLVAGGTQTHLLIVDLRNTPLTGKDGEARLQAAGILANKQLVPKDERPPTVSSGVRMGSPCSAARGLQPEHMRQVALWTKRVLLDGEDPARVKAEVVDLARRFPVPGIES